MLTLQAILGNICILAIIKLNLRRAIQIFLNRTIYLDKNVQIWSESLQQWSVTFQFRVKELK